MAAKKDPFSDFAEKIVQAPKVTDSKSSVSENKSMESVVAPQPEAVSPAPVSPSLRGRKPTVAGDAKPFTVHIRTDLLKNIKQASFKTDMSAKAIINQALEEYFEKHKGLL